MTFSDKLSKLRRMQNYTQEQFADLLGVSRQTVSKWESGIAYPETDKLIKISDMFSCSIDYLLRDAIDDPTPIQFHIAENAEPKKKRRVVAVTAVAVLVVALLAAVFIPRRGLVTIDCEGYEGFRATYREVGAVGYISQFERNMYPKGVWQDMPNETLTPLEIEFEVIDYKNIAHNNVGNTIMVDFDFNTLFLKDTSGKYIIFEMIDYEDYPEPDEQETA